MLFDRFILINLLLSDGTHGALVTISSERVHCGFEIDKSIDSEGDNGAEIWFYNPSQSTINLLNAKTVGKSTVEVYCGYVQNGSIEKIYTGDIVAPSVSNDGGNTKVTIKSTIGYNASHAGNVSMTWANNTPLSQIVSEIAALDMFTIKGAGDIVDRPITLEGKSFVNKVMGRGITCEGNPKIFLMELLRNTGHVVVDNGDVITIQTETQWKTGESRTIVLNSDTGMVGIPELIASSEDQTTNEDLDIVQPKKGDSPIAPKVGYRAKGLINTGAKLGDTVRLSSNILNIKDVMIKIESLNFSGSNYDNEYYTTYEGYIYDESI